MSSFGLRLLLFDFLFWEDYGNEVYRNCIRIGGAKNTTILKSIRFEFFSFSLTMGKKNKILKNRKQSTT